MPANRRRPRALALAACAFLSIAPVLVKAEGAPNAPQPEPTNDPPAASATERRFVVTFDPGNIASRVTVYAPGGVVSAADLAAAVACAKGYDETALEGLFPDKALDLHKKRYRFLLVMANALLAPRVKMEVAKPEEDGGEREALVVDLDRTALLSSKRAFLRRFRAAVTGGGGIFGMGRTFGIEPDEQWQDAPADRNLVVLLHGLDSTPENVAPVLKSIREAGLPCAVFRYPNDQPIADSAKLLAKELARLRELQATRSVTLLTSSMGGLVARAAVENPDLDPGNVRQMILVGTPNHGSALARFEFGLDLYEHLASEDERGKARRLYEMIEDGLGEAGKDLRPDSAFLKELNARPRNPKVRYSLILGQGGYLTQANLDAARAALAKQKDRNRFTRFLGKQVEDYLKDLDEVVTGLGDGAVSLARGKLEGVADTEVLAFHHLQMFDGSADENVAKLREAVLKRLKAPPPPPERSKP
ncbi:MAG: GPI inositol-deacylase [Planctomycetes bacterium]|nr:GPI inositol-deacylase [Planctomycetota bacterium]